MHIAVKTENDGSVHFTAIADCGYRSLIFILPLNRKIMNYILKKALLSNKTSRKKSNILSE